MELPMMIPVSNRNPFSKSASAVACASAVKHKESVDDDEFGAFLKNPNWLPSTPSTATETPTSTLDSSHCILDAAFMTACDFDGLNSISGLIVPEIDSSEDDDDYEYDQAGDYDGEGCEEDDDFDDAIMPSAEFGDFNVAPPPSKLKDLVSQFTKVIEEEEKFVKLYKQNFKSDPNSTRKALSANGFEFRKAKMVRMLSSRVIQEKISENDQDDELSVVMSVCTTHTSRTGYSEATTNTAARLLERLKDPTDHDSVVSKELKSLSPQELAERFVSMQEKLAEVQKKKKSKKAKKKKKKAKKKKKREEEEARRQSEGTDGLVRPKSILKKSESLGECGRPKSMVESIEAERRLSQERRTVLDSDDQVSTTGNSVNLQQSAKDSEMAAAVKKPPGVRSKSPNPAQHSSLKSSAAINEVNGPKKPKTFWKKLMPKRPTYSTRSQQAANRVHKPHACPGPGGLKKIAPRSSLSRGNSGLSASLGSSSRSKSSRISSRSSGSPSSSPRQQKGAVRRNSSKDLSHRSLQIVQEGFVAAAEQPMHAAIVRDNSGQTSPPSLVNGGSLSLSSGDNPPPSCPAGEDSGQEPRVLIRGSSSSVCSASVNGEGCGRISTGDEEDEVLFLF